MLRSTSSLEKKMKLSNRSRFILVMSVLGLMLVLSPARSAGPNPGQSSAYGKPLAEWMKIYWTWFLGGPQAGAVKNVTFLPVPAGVPSDIDPTVAVGELDVSLANGQALALPMFTFYGESYLPETGLADDDSSFPPADVFTSAEVLIKLDGKIILDSSKDDLSPFYFDPQYFHKPIVYAEPSSYGSDAAIWVKGIGFVHPPLSTGKHRLELFVYNHTDFGFGLFGYANTWNISVGKK